jgi:hypothetical protein
MDRVYVYLVCFYTQIPLMEVLPDALAALDAHKDRAAVVTEVVALIHSLSKEPANRVRGPPPPPLQPPFTLSQQHQE